MTFYGCGSHFGFLSAVEEARQVILHMHTEVSSNPRVGIIQLFGSDSGFIASHAGYSTACDLVLIPEDPMTMNEIFSLSIKQEIDGQIWQRTNSAGPYAIVRNGGDCSACRCRGLCQRPARGPFRQGKEGSRRFYLNGRRFAGKRLTNYAEPD